MTKKEAQTTAQTNSARHPNGWYDVWKIFGTERFIVSEDASGNDLVGGYESIELEFVCRYINGKQKK